MTLSYDDRKGQPATTASNEGYHLLDRHFRKDIVIAEFLVVESPTDMRTGKGLADLDEMASRVAQVPGVTKVSGVTRPAGARLEQAQLGWQNGQIGDKMAGAVGDGDARKDDLARLTGGADQLAGGLAQLDTTLRAALTSLTGILNQAHTVGPQVDQLRPLLNQLSVAAPSVDDALRSGPGLRPLAEQADNAVATIDPLVGVLNTSPWCATTPQCAQIRDQTQVLVTLRNAGFFTQVAGLGDNVGQNASVAGTLAEVQSAVTSMDKAFGVLGNPADMAGNVRRLQDGIGQLAFGAQALATGVHTLADSNIEMLSGMSQIATQLQNSARASTGSDTASGFFLPPNAFENRQFAYVGKTIPVPRRQDRPVRHRIQRRPLHHGRHEPGPPDRRHRRGRPPQHLPGPGQDLGRRVPRRQLRHPEIALRRLPPTGRRHPAHRGPHPGSAAARTAGPALPAGHRRTQLRRLTGHRRVVLPVGPWLRNRLAGATIAFIILVAVGADYNMLLVSRLKEESTRNIRVGVLRTVANTGSVITSAGIIFAASMLGLMMGSIAIMIQAGFIIGCGLLLDTFVVRTLTVPSIAVLLREASWWPQRGTTTPASYFDLKKSGRANHPQKARHAPTFSGRSS